MRGKKRSIFGGGTSSAMDIDLVLTENPRPVPEYYANFEHIPRPSCNRYIHNTDVIKFADGVVGNLTYIHVKSCLVS